jgi:hypothetical protein
LFCRHVFTTKTMCLPWWLLSGESTMDWKDNVGFSIFAKLYLLEKNSHFCDNREFPINPSCYADVFIGVESWLHEANSWGGGKPVHIVFKYVGISLKDDVTIILLLGVSLIADKITKMTPNPKCRLYWRLDWRYIQSSWYFRPLLWTCAL